MVPVWEFKNKPMHGSYEIYGGEFGETIEPKIGDAKVAFTFDGKLAADMFRKMGKDSTNIIYSEPGERIKQKGDLDCRKSAKGIYSCTLGVDLKSGKSIPGSDC